MNLKNLCICFIAILLGSCSAKKNVVYFQDALPGEEIKVIECDKLRLQADDMISVLVSSKNPELARIFNSASFNVSNESGTSDQSAQSEQLAYTVSSKGMIDMPVLGQIEVAGLTKEEVADKIRKLIVDGGYLKDPSVVVKFENLQFSILGEVSSPGRYSLTKDKTTILEALSMAGDLTINGQRDKVFLIRDENGAKRNYQLDLRTKAVYMSPAYYVKQNDVIYVEPNKKAAAATTANGNTLSSVAFWMSFATFITTITNLIIRR